MQRESDGIAGVFEKTSKSGIWYIRYREDGKLIRRRIGSRAKAVAELNKIKGSMRTQRRGAETHARKETHDLAETSAKSHCHRPKITIGELCDDYLASILDANNYRRPRDLVNPQQRVRVIKQHLCDRSAEALLPYEIDDWLLSLKRKPGTLNRYKSTLSAVYRHAKSRGKISLNPAREVAQYPVCQPEPRWLLDEEEIRLRSVLERWVEKCPSHHRLKCLFLRCHAIELTIALCTGLRKSNIYALRWDRHIDMVNRSFRLPPEMMKGRKVLSLPMIDDAYDALVELRMILDEIDVLQSSTRRNGKQPERMFANGRIFPCRENREWWAAALREADIQNFRFHDLRHSFATRLIRSGVSLRLVQEACHHANISMTVRYTHADDTQLRQALSVLNRKNLDCFRLKPAILPTVPTPSKSMVPVGSARGSSLLSRRAAARRSKIPPGGCARRRRGKSLRSRNRLDANGHS